MHELYELKEKLMKELEKYGAKGEMTAGTLDVVDKLSHTIKNLCKIIEEAEYSNAMGGNMYGGGSYRGSYRGSYEGGNSSYDGSYARGGNESYAMARGRGRNAKRDSMGRYSSADMVADLRELMQEAPDERTRREFEQFIRKMETM